MPKGVWDRSKSEATQRYLDTIRLSPDEKKISMKAAQERYNARYPERRAEQQRKAHMKANYGLTLDTLEALIAHRHGTCDICGDAPAPDSMGRTLHVDHDHNTGKVRGMLCRECNFGLGKFQDDIMRLRGATQYLVRAV
jgi:hypothetical protein